MAALVGVVLFAALWMVALKPAPNGGTGASAPTAPGMAGLGRAIAKAHGAATTAAAAGAAAAGESTPAAAPAAVAPKPSATAAKPSTPAAQPSAPAATRSTPAARPAAPKPAVPATKPAAPVATPAVHSDGGAGGRLATVTRALAAHDVLALLFYNPAAPEDRAVAAELAGVKAQAGVVKLAVPIGELASYAMITAQVPVTGAPTLVMVDRGARATTTVGYVDAFAISQDIADALAAR
jgi:hypothetical protein